MKTLHALAPLATVITALLGCSGSPGEYPIGNVILKDNKSTISKVIGDNETYAWGLRELSPISNDGPHAHQNLRFSPAFPPGNPRQDVIAFDLDLEQPILDPQPNIDFVPLANGELNTVSVVAGTDKSYSFPFSGTGHIIRYWHGLCSAKTPWGPVFDQISSALFSGIEQAARDNALTTAFQRDFDEFQPMFNSFETFLDHGFLFEAQFTAFVGPLGSFPFVMNPAYTMTTDSANGMVKVTPIHFGLVPANSALHDALNTTLPQGVEAAIASQLEMPVSTSVVNDGCSPSATLRDQQNHCFDVLAQGNGSPMDVVFSLALRAAGQEEQAADATAHLMVKALEPRNFSCPKPAKGDKAVCAFHPIVLRVNVLPDVLELVFATDNPATQKEFDEQLLYVFLPDVAEFLNKGSGPSADFCNHPVGSPDGSVPVRRHGQKFVNFFGGGG